MDGVGRGDLLAASLPARALLAAPVPTDRDPAAIEVVLEAATVAAMDGDLRRGKLDTAGRYSSRLYHAQIAPPPHDPLRLPRVTPTTEARNLAMLALLMTLESNGLNEACAMARVAQRHIDGDREPAVQATASLLVRFLEARCAQDPRAAYAAIDEATAAGVVPGVAERLRPRLERPVLPAEEVKTSPSAAEHQAVALAFALMGDYRRGILRYSAELMSLIGLMSRVISLANLARLRWELGLDHEWRPFLVLANQLADAMAIPTPMTQKMKAAADKVDLDMRLAGEDDGSLATRPGWRAAAAASLTDEHCADLDIYAFTALLAGDAALAMQLAAAATQLSADGTAWFEDRQHRALAMACGLAASGGSSRQPEVVALLDEALTTNDERARHERAERAARAARVAEHVGAIDWATSATAQALETFVALGNMARPPILRERLGRLAAR